MDFLEAQRRINQIVREHKGIDLHGMPVTLAVPHIAEVLEELNSLVALTVLFNPTPFGFANANDLIPVPAPTPIRCECGGEKTGTGHSTWCPLVAATIPNP